MSAQRANHFPRLAANGWADTSLVRQLAPLGVAQGWENGRAFGPFAGNCPLLLIAKFGRRKILPHTPTLRVGTSGKRGESRDTRKERR
ncbi:MAG: hypothetical protein K8R46_03190 [Pirellulales bacterium]|nr:hypothetical protein [Pirellulales bacterium]